MKKDFEESVLQEPILHILTVILVRARLSVLILYCERSCFTATKKIISYIDSVFVLLNIQLLHVMNSSVMEYKS